MADTAEPAEELEPLFDYTRVQPFDVVCLDDGSFSSTSEEKVQNTGNVINIDNGDDDDLDWLAPPPKVVVDKAKLSENSTIKELRLKKQELMSFTESAKDMFKTVEESVKRNLKASMDSSSESLIEKPSKPAVERQKIVISIQDKDGLKQFRVYRIAIVDVIIGRENLHSYCRLGIVEPIENAAVEEEEENKKYPDCCPMQKFTTASSSIFEEEDDRENSRMPLLLFINNLTVSFPKALVSEKSKVSSP
ncbi:hypothetical protein L1887_35074 [Cichorium endivia]|nr:hypothetical protein L1887_35074 [Cichorium endivia]